MLYTKRNVIRSGNPCLTIFIFAIFSITQTWGNVFDKNPKNLMAIEGHVTDEKGTPVEGAALKIKWSEIESETDNDGVFRMTATAGDTIIVEHINYQPVEFVVQKSKTNYFVSFQKSKNRTFVNANVNPKIRFVDVQGKVIDENGNNLPFAILVVRETNQGTSADSTGQFKISGIPDDSRLRISHVGFNSQELDLEKSKTKYEISLKRAAVSLSEIVVIGYLPVTFHNQISSKESTTLNGSKKEWAIIEQNPEFPGGNDSLFKYLGRNIRYPSKALKAEIQGRVFVSFTVSEDGSIQNPRIIKGMGYGLDEEALRVILNMPPWKPARQMNKAVPADFELPINFSLEY